MYRFFEVFKTLKLPEDLAVYFENVEVTKVSKTSTNSLARVYKIDNFEFKQKLFNTYLDYYRSSYV